MNVITYNQAYCLYAKATTRGMVNLLLKEPSRAILLALDKYEERGYVTRRLVVARARCLFYEQDIRWVGDGQCWRMPLPWAPFSVEARTRVDPISATSWSLATYPVDYHRTHFRVCTDEPSVFPLVVGSTNVQEFYQRAIRTHGETEAFHENERTVTGGDK